MRLSSVIRIDHLSLFRSRKKPLGASPSRDLEPDLFSLFGHLTDIRRRLQDLTTLRSLQLATQVFYELAPYDVAFQQKLEMKAAKFDHLLMSLLVTLFTADDLAGLPGSVILPLRPFLLSVELGDKFLLLRPRSRISSPVSGLASHNPQGTRFSVLALAEDSDLASNSEVVLIRSLSTLICRNLVGYCQIKSKAHERLSSPIVFAPQLSASATGRSAPSTPNASFSMSTLSAASGIGRGAKGHPPSLGAESRRWQAR